MCNIDRISIYCYEIHDSWREKKEKVARFNSKLESPTILPVSVPGRSLD